MYSCKDCGASFTAPAVRTETVPDGLGCRKETRAVCPLCGGSCLEEVELCPVCGRWSLPRGQALCGLCRQRLLQRFAAFAGELTPPEREVLDEVLEGVGVEAVTG